MKAGNFPSVSYIKLPAYQDGHAGYSDPLDEQEGTVALIDFLEQQPDWKSTAVVITWDDFDGWYDHAFANVTSPSFDAEADQLDGPGKCGTGTPLPGIGGKPVNGRCGPGTRLPFLVISPWAKANYVGHDQISLTSVVRFIEDNWLHGQRIGSGSFDATAGSIDGYVRLCFERQQPSALSRPGDRCAAVCSAGAGRRSLKRHAGPYVLACRGRTAHRGLGYRNCGCGRSSLALSLRRQRARRPLASSRRARTRNLYDLSGRPLSHCPPWHNSAASFSSMPAYRRPVGCPAPRVTARDMPMRRPATCRRCAAVPFCRAKGCAQYRH